MHDQRILSVTVQLTPVTEDREAAVRYMLIAQALLAFRSRCRPCFLLSHVLLNVHPHQGGRLFVGGDVPELAEGTAVVFPSYMPHRVEPVREGSREAMIAFFEGTSARLLQSQLLVWRPQQHDCTESIATWNLCCSDQSAGSDSRFERLAMRALSSAVLAWPEQHKLRTLLGEAQLETGELAEALQTLVLAARHDDKQQQNNSRDFHTLDMLGVAMYLGGRLSEAEATFAQAKAASPELATGYAKLGSTLMRQGRQEEAASCYEKAISSAEQAVRSTDKIHFATLCFHKGSTFCRTLC